MLRSIATVSISGTLPEKLAAIAAAGFEGVEIFENDLLYYPGKPADIRHMVQEMGLQITLFQPFRDFEGCPRHLLANNLERVRRKFEVMHELGCDRMLLCSNVAPDCSAEFDVQVADLALLADLARQHDIQVGYEALAWGTHVNRYRQAWQRVQAVDNPALGIVLDSFHILALGDRLDQLDDIPVDKITFLQLADAPLLKMDVLSWSRHFRCFPGQGELPLIPFCTALTRKGYRGPWSLEVFNDGFRASPNAPTAKDGYRSLLYLEEQTRLALGQEGIRHYDDQLFLSAPLPAYQGIEFIEFAVSPTEAERLGTELQQLGLSLVGQHRSKQVQLYRNGGVNVIMNHQPDSWAEGYHDRHGASLCAMALQVQGVDRLLQRARDFGYAIYDGEAGPNEQAIPALCTPDGSLIYLVEVPTTKQADIYHSDFHLTSSGADATEELTRIDHLVFALPEGIRENWVMFFRSVLGFQLENEWMLPDPYGLVRSQVIRSVCGNIRIPLNISLSRDTLIAQAVETYHGVGLQHVAFSCRDIFHSVACMQERSLSMLRIPQNYYQDLAARFGGDNPLLPRLAPAQVLYDQDSQHGELLHVYTRPAIEGRFFFELIERRGGYEQYGAVNAPVRLSAMRQPK